MPFRSAPDGPAESRLRDMETLDLLALCIADRDAAPAWREFLRRVTPKIKAFIRGILRQMSGTATSPGEKPVLFGGMQETDLYQATILRLVEPGSGSI